MAIKLKVILLIAVFILSACEGGQDFKINGTEQELSVAMEKWSRSCALCHVRGEGGAPLVGDAEAWAPRLAQGEAVILRHTLDGFGKMPPLGYCMDCTERDYLVLIDFMAGQ